MATATASSPINFANYTLKALENILTATPKSNSNLCHFAYLYNSKIIILTSLKIAGGPAVSVDLNQVIGNDGGKLKFGGRDFSKTCKDIKMVEKLGTNWLVAHCLTKTGTYEPSELKLDGSLQITVANKVRDVIDINLLANVLKFMLAFVVPAT